ncbi:hypothetical protein B5E92_11195 [Erysipelatoclostridium sp. An15]|uniref:VapD family protein n=1 Tax=unclassified Thomasclavelia TaxID=3025756 RepID=UPI000B387B04|nr:VapD family protein [Erysipelatoclostridium sp. An15]OUQ06773.1 hypothetical protein B5E92_11195 [Erysipelatoclostridium sp. An15]
MQTSISRKAINFDLSENLLKKYYPSKNYRNSWREIKKFLEKSDFIHRQYSGYVSRKCIPMADVLNIITEMAIKLKWLKLCVIEFDVTIVGNNYSLISHIYNANFDI